MASLPRGTHVGRVALSVGDLDRATSFYGDVVGLAVRRRDGDRAVLGAGDDDLLVLRAAPDAPERPADAAGLYHVAYLFPSRAALARALARVRDQWRLTGASDHLVSEALYCDDPGGNGVELYRDRPREQWTPTPDGGVEIDTLPLDLDDLAKSAAGSADGTAPSGTSVGHVHLEVTDLDRARAFYVDALGFDVMERVPGALFVAAGGYHHHVGLNVWQGRSAPAAGRGLDWFEVALPAEDARATAVERLRAADAPVAEHPDHVAVEDPDGIELRLVVAD